MSVPPVSSSLQVPVDSLDSAQVLDAPTPATTVSASGYDPVLPASYLVRDPEQIAASEALLVLHEGQRASESSLLAETIPETHARHLSDSGCTSAFRRFTGLRGHHIL